VSIGAVVAFTMLAGRVAAPLVQVAGLLHAVEHARGAVGEVGSVMNSPPEGGRSGTGLKQPIYGSLICDNVRFRHGPTAPYALDEVSFQVPQGTLFGIMGRSGSGKTTVTRLLQGLDTGRPAIGVRRRGASDRGSVCPRADTPGANPQGCWGRSRRRA
jgi:ATP-binding cassette, subfamily B, bacterial HlyB/CyaB